MIPADLLQKLKARDRATLAKIFSDSNPFLFKMLGASGIKDEAAEDLVHQTWEKFFTNLEKFEGRSSLKTFLAGILVNQLREHRRAGSKVDKNEDSAAALERAFTPDGWWKNGPPDPSRLLESKELAHHIGACAEELSQAQRTAFMLKEVEQEDSEEICNVLGVNVSNLRVLIFRAKEKLRLCLEGRIG